MRARIVEKLGLFGAVLDPDVNAASATRIAAQASRIDMHVVATDEER
jgi:acetate kinase